MDMVDLRRSLQGTPATLWAVAGGLTAAALSYREAAGHWTAFEVLCHFLDAEEHNWIPRARVFLAAGGDRRFAPFDREQGRRLYRDWSVDAMLAEFERRRSQNLAALDGLELTPADLDRRAEHPQLGVVTLQQLLATWVTHDHAHLAQIARVLVRYHGQDVGPWRAFFSLLREA